MRTLLHTRLVRTLGANVLGRLVQALGPVLSVPLFLHAWGAVGYGEWLVLATVPGYLMGFADFGLPTVAANEMTMRVSRDDPSGARVVFQSTWALVTALTLGVLGVAVAAVWALPLERWLHLQSMTPSELRLALTFLIGGVFVSQQGFLASAGLRCVGAFSLQAFVTSLLAAVTLGVQVVILSFGGSPAAVAAGMFGTSTTALVVWAVLMHTRVPWLTWGASLADRATVRELLRPAIAYLGLGLNNALSVQGVLTALGLVLGPVAVASFSTVRTMTNAARQAMTLVNVSVWPEVTESYGAGHLDRARRLHRGAVAASFWLGLAVLAILAVAGPTIYRLWVGGEVAFDLILFYALLGAAFAGLVGYTSSVVHLAVNRHARLAAVQTAGSLVVFGTALLVAPTLGVPSVGVALLVVESAVGIWIVRRSTHLLDDTPRPLVRAVLRPSLHRLVRPIAPEV